MKKLLPFHWALIGITFVCLFQLEDDGYFTPWLNLCIAGTILVSFFVTKKTHWAVGLFTLSTLMSSILVFGIKMRYQNTLNPSQILAIDNTTLYSAFTLLLMICGLSFLKEGALQGIEKALAVLCLGNSLIVIVQWLMGLNSSGLGFLGNESMNGTLIALTYPFLSFYPEPIKYDKYSLREVFKHFKLEAFTDALICLVPVVAIFLHKQSIPSGLMLAMILVYMFFNTDIKLPKKARLPVIFSVFIVFTTIAWFVVPNLFNSTGRFFIWAKTWEWFWAYVNPMLGTGNGSYVMFGPLIQQEAGDMGMLFWTAHNDYLQVLFEQGIPGFISVLILTGFVLIKSLKQHVYLTCSAVAYVLASLMNFPAHTAMTALIGAFLVYRIMGHEKRYE